CEAAASAGAAAAPALVAPSANRNRRRPKSAGAEWDDEAPALPAGCDALRMPTSKSEIEQDLSLSVDGERIALERQKLFGQFCYSVVIIGKRTFCYCAAALECPGKQPFLEEIPLLRQRGRRAFAFSRHQDAHRLAQRGKMVFHQRGGFLSSDFEGN